MLILQVAPLHKWFTDRSRLDNEANNQTPIAHAQKLTPAGLGRERYDDLVSYLTDNMNLFKNPAAKDALVPASGEERKKIVTALLDGLSKTVRYTRLDDPAEAFQLTEKVLIEKKDKGAIRLGLMEPSKIVLKRHYKNGEDDVTPLDRAMIGHAWVPADGQPLGDRGALDLSTIAIEANALAHAGRPVIPLPYMYPSGAQAAEL